MINVINRNLDDISRFLSKINKTEFCWNWVGYKRNNYGTFTIKNKSFQAHRFSFELYVGEIPEGMLICHRCDNPSCVRPDHLFLGTHKDNTDDCISKGRFKSYEDRAKNYVVPFNKERDELLLKVYYSGGSLKDMRSALGLKGNGQIYRILERNFGKPFKFKPYVKSLNNEP